MWVNVCVRSEAGHRVAYSGSKGHSEIAGCLGEPLSLESSAPVQNRDLHKLSARRGGAVDPFSSVTDLIGSHLSCS